MTADRRFGRSKGPQPLGTPGPLIRAEIGDTIHVVFRDHCTFPASAHVRRLFCTGGNEDAPYWEGHTAVPPGHAVPPD